jgi:acyl dehydratase
MSGVMKEVAMRTITSVDDAVQAIGAELGTSDWLGVEQDRIDLFADVTRDHQWIHVDAERAAVESPYGATIAHGFLTISLIPGLSKETYRIEGAKMGINYGLNKVRFLSPVTAGSRLRLHSRLIDATPVGEDAVNLTVRHTLEIEGTEKPAAVADLIARFIF